MVIEGPRRFARGGLIGFAIIYALLLPFVSGTAIFILAMMSYPGTGPNAHSSATPLATALLAAAPASLIVAVVGGWLAFRRNRNVWTWVWLALPLPWLIPAALVYLIGSVR